MQNSRLHHLSQKKKSDGNYAKPPIRLSLTGFQAIFKEILFLHLDTALFAFCVLIIAHTFVFGDRERFPPVECLVRESLTGGKKRENDFL